MSSKNRLTGHMSSDLAKIIPQVQIAGGAGVTDHGALTGLSDDDHTNYVHLANARTITGQHSFSPGAAQAPFLLGANAQSQLVTGLRADELNKSVIAGSGLANGGILTSDVTLNIGAGNGITVNADDVALTTPGTLTSTTTNTSVGNHTHAITTTTDGQANPLTILQANASGVLTLLRVNIWDRLVHNADTDTYLEFTNDQLDFILGSVNMLRLEEAANDLIMMGNGADLVMYSDNFTTETARIASDGTITGTFSVDLSANTGDGLVWDAGNEEIDLGTPSTLTAATSNAVTASSHTHAITTTSDAAGTPSTILAGDGSGDLYVRQIFVDDLIRHDGDADTYLQFDVDSFKVFVGGENQLLINNTAIFLYDLVKIEYDASNYAYLQTEADGNFLFVNAGTDAGLTLQPDKNIIVDPQGNQVDPATNYDINLGQNTKRYLSIHAAEIEVETLIAQDVISTIGGEIIVSPTSELTADIAASETNIMANNGFETVSAGPDWTSWTETTGDGSFTDETTLVYAGSHAAKITAGATANTWLDQDRTVTSGELYVLTVWTRGDGTGSGGQVGIYDVTNSVWIEDLTATGIAGTTYTRYGVGFRVPSTCSTIRIRLKCSATNTAATYYDEVNLYQSSFLTKHNAFRHDTIVRLSARGNIEFVRLHAGGSDTYSGTELFGNNGFETAGGGGADVFASWGENDDSAKSTITRDSAQKQAGTYSCKITTDTAGSLGRVFQSPTCEPNTWYRITFWTRGSGTYAGRWDGYWSGVAGDDLWIVTYLSETGNSTTTWKKVEFETKSPPSATNLALRFYCTGQVGHDVWFDEVYVTKASGEYEWAAERDLDGTGMNAWIAGDAVSSTGRPGDGFINLFAETSVRAGDDYGPTIVGYVRDSLTYNDFGERWAIGNLRGLYGYAGTDDLYGLGLGKYSTTTSYITIDDTNGIRIIASDQIIGQWDISGNLTLGEVATNQGNAYWNNTNKRLEFRGGTNGTVVHSLINTSGAFIVGDGTTNIASMNQDGIQILAQSSYQNKYSLSFMDSLGGTVRSALQASYSASTFSTMQMWSEASGIHADPDPYIRVETDSTTGAGIVMSARSIISSNTDIFRITTSSTDDTNLLELRATSWAGHGITALTGTKVFGYARIFDTADGGLRIMGLSDSEQALVLNGTATNDNTTKNSSALAPVRVISRKKSGTGTADVGTNGNMFVIAKSGTSGAVWFVDVEGDTYRDGSDNTFDEYDDAQLIRAFDVALDSPGRIDDGFDKFLKYNANDLEQLGILHPPGPQGERFYNVTRLGRLHNGAIWQLYQENQRLKERVEKLEARI